MRNKYGIIAIHSYPSTGKEMTIKDLVPLLESKEWAITEEKLREELAKPLILSHEDFMSIEA